MNRRSSSRSPTRWLSGVARKRCEVRNFVVGLQLVLLLIGAVFVGCSGDDERPDWGGFGGGDGVSTGPCDKGEQRECGFTMDRGDGYVACYRGTQHCTAKGRWSACEDGEITSEPMRDTEGLRGFYRRFKPTALSTPVSCMDACDPSCMLFDEDPPDITPDPGGNIDTIPDWSAPGGPICDHELCETGAALDPTCHPCAQTVCALDSSCCSANWDADCVDLAAEHCGSAPPEGPSICDYTLFSETTITGGNNDGILVGGPIGAGQSTGTSINLGKVKVDRVVTAGSITLDQTDVKYTVSWGSGGSLTCQNSPKVGAATCPTGTTSTGGGTYPPNTPASGALPTIPTHDVVCINQSGSVQLNSAGTQAFSPGEARRIEINNNGAKAVLTGPGTYYGVHFNSPGTLVFAQPGTYTFNHLHMGGNDPKILMPPSGTVKVDVCSNLHFDNKVEVYKYSGACTTGDWTCAATMNRPAAGSVIWYTEQVCAASTEVKVGPGALVSGILIAPDCKVHIYSGNATGSVQGLVYSQAIQLEPGVQIDSTGLVGEVCKATGVDGLAPTCDLETAVPDMPPPFNEPCESGLDCQVNSRCTNVNTDSACAHSKCVEGAALSLACRAGDSCVDRICMDEPACCSTSWSSSCVNRVKSTCDSWCGPLSGCAHSVCSTGSALSSACDTGAAGSGNCASQVCANAAYAYCCSTYWDSACAARAKAVCTGTPSMSEDRCNYAVIGNTLNLVNSTNLTGGSLQTANAVPTQTCSSGSTHATYNTTATMPLTVNGDVVISNNVQVTLTSGTYNIRTLTMGSNSQLRLPNTGNVVLNVCGDVFFGAGSRVLTNTGGTFSGADLLRLRLNTNGNITSAAGAQTRGVFMARGSSSVITLNGGVSSTRSPEHHGVLWTNGTVTRSGTPLNNINNSIHPGSCQASITNTFPSLLACPVTTPTSSVSASEGTCVLNDDGFVDGSCALQDLAVGFACDNELSVCNHGNVAAVAGAVVRFYPREAHQFATTSPDPAWSVGTCTVTSAIPVGECVTQACDDALFDQDLTLHVTASGLECSALDNWSMYQEGGECLPVGVDNEEVVTEVYTATCPDAMSPRWDELGWQAETPGGSRVLWRARAAKTEAGLAAESFEDIGSAHGGTPNTQNCPINGSCAIDIADELWGSGVINHPPVLEIEATVIASGTDLPTLHEWKVSYTCVYDE